MREVQVRMEGEGCEKLIKFLPNLFYDSINEGTL